MSIRSFGSVSGISQSPPGFDPGVGGDSMILSPGENILVSTDADTITDSASYVKLRDTEVFGSGRVRVSFRMSIDTSSAAGKTVNGRVYINGSAVGTERTISGTLGATTYDEDFDVVSGDNVQIYGKTNAGVNGECKISNFRLKTQQAFPTYTIVL